MDGCCIGNGTVTAKVGVGIFFGENNPMNISRPVYQGNTNNYAEIEAAIIAAKLVRFQGNRKIRFHTDSKFLIQAATKWISTWVIND